MYVNMRGLSTVFSIVLLAIMTGSVQARQDSQELEPTYVPEGTWLAIATATNGSTKLFMDTYASDQNQHGSSGTVVCTLAQGRVTLPLGPQGVPISVTGTQTGQGRWARVEKNVYAFTAWRILTDIDGKGVGWAKFSGKIKPDSRDHFLGEITATFFTPGFVQLPIPSVTTPTEGWRVVVEGE